MVARLQHAFDWGGFVFSVSPRRPSWMTSRVSNGWPLSGAAAGDGGATPFVHRPALNHRAWNRATGCWAAMIPLDMQARWERARWTCCKPWPPGWVRRPASASGQHRRGFAQWRLRSWVAASHAYPSSEERRFLMMIFSGLAAMATLRLHRRLPPRQHSGPHRGQRRPLRSGRAAPAAVQDLWMRCCPAASGASNRP